jgi:hypothetical protein
VVFAHLFTLSITPFPLSYASALLPRAYHIDIKDMGPGSYEAAAWLNALPDAATLTVWTDKDGVCKFFVGSCRRGFGNYEKLRYEELDYIVVSSGRESRTSKMIGGQVANGRQDVIRFDLFYQRTDPAFEVRVNGRPSHFVKVFRFTDEELQ